MYFDVFFRGRISKNAFFVVFFPFISKNLRWLELRTKPLFLCCGVREQSAVVILVICCQINFQLPNKGFYLPIFNGKTVFLAFYFLWLLYVNFYTIYVDFMLIYRLLAFQNMDELKN